MIKWSGGPFYLANTEGQPRRMEIREPNPQQKTNPHLSPRERSKRPLAVLGEGHQTPKKKTLKPLIHRFSGRAAAIAHGLGRNTGKGAAWRHFGQHQ